MAVQPALAADLVSAEDATKLTGVRKTATGGVRRFSDHCSGFGSTARQGNFFPGFSGIFQDFPVFFRIFRDSSVYFVIFRYSSSRGTARRLKALLGRAVRFSVYEQHWSSV